MPRGGKLWFTVVFAISCGFAWGLHTCGEGLEHRARSKSTARPVPRRLAVLSPAAVEIVYELGAGERIVGATRFATYPPAAKALPDIGGVLDINYERLAALEPDLIIAQTTDQRLARFAERRGIALYAVEIETAENVLEACRSLGSRLGLPARGEALASRIAASLAETESRTASLPRTPCFISVDRGPGRLTGMLTTGAGTFLTEMVKRVGGRNVFDDLDQHYPVISKETLLARAPEAVLEFKPGADPAAAEMGKLIGDWQNLPGLPAVRRDRIHVIHHDDALLPGPRIAEVAREVSRALHPEAWPAGGEAN